MNASSFDIKEILEAYGESSGLGLDYAINLFRNKMPSQPINCVVIYDTNGYPPYLGLGGETGYEYPSIQVLVRNTNFTNGWDIIEKIKDVLHGKHQEVWNGTLYSSIRCVSGPALLDYDENGNARLIINFDLQRRVM